MAKHRQTDQRAVATLDQVLLELFAGQLLLEPVAAKRPGEPARHPTSGRSPRKKAKAGPRDKTEAG
jgi:hypothetical protein